MTPLLTATELSRWADHRRAQELLPLLVRRLIVASVNPVRINIAAGDSVNQPGYDGCLQTGESTAFIPAGQSVWELGTGQKPAEKAEADYAARTADPGHITPRDTSFVFVTPRRWQGKTAWAQSKLDENVWADVRAYDADDLEQWLDQTRSVAAWARRVVAGVPDGVRDVEDVWDQWTLRTNPRLLPDVFLAGRDEAADRGRAWLNGPASCLRVRAASPDEAIGFLAALVEALPERDRERVRARALLVSTPDAWRAVASQHSPVVLLAMSATLGSDAQAVARGHHVFLAYGNEAAGVAVDVELPHLRRQPLADALRRMGVPGDRAHAVAGESRGRIAALVELLGGGTTPPHWSAPAVAPQLVPLLLAGSWCQTPGDTEAMCRLTRLGADELAALQSRWVNETDPPIRLVGGMWEWVSRLRAWPHLGPHISPADAGRFREVALEVIGERDPRLDLPPDERWMAAVRGRAPRYSEALRRGLADGLALLASRPASVRQCGDPTGLVRGVVRGVFGPAPDAARWYSLAPVLRTLAEAAPDEFLAAVERDVLGDAAVRSALFQEEGMFGGSRHTELLWALEVLAWCPEYLARVAVILAGLAAHDPGGRLANRPRASLRMIFLPWRPYTMGTVAQRLCALDAIHRRYPNIAFDLCVQLMPQTHDHATPTPQPRWRDWNVDRERPITLGEYWEAVEGAFDRLLAWAGDDQGRWARLIDPIPGVSPERIVALLDALESLPLESLADMPGGPLRRAVRHLLHEKRTIEGIFPHVTPEVEGRLEAVYARLRPADPVERHAWLFDHNPALLSVRGHDWEAEQAARTAERDAAIHEALEAGDAAAVLGIANVAQAPFAIGFHLGRSDFPEAALPSLFDACLRGDLPLHNCLGGIASVRFHQGGWPWVERLFTDATPRAWAAAEKARFALALPFETATWDWVEGWGEDAAAAYWRLTNCRWVTDAARDAPRAIRTFLDRGRVFAAFHLVSIRIPDRREAIPPALLVEVLRAVTAAATGQIEAVDAPPSNGGLAYEVSELLTSVEESGLVEESELARLEWVWLPALDHTPRGLRTLDRVLARDPAFFAMVVGFIYRPRLPDAAEQPNPPSEADRNRASQAWRLLHEWRGLPGRGADSTIDTEALRRWVIDAREALRASGHAEVGDHHIGEVLARVPAGDDGAWPHQSLRNLLEELASEDIEEGVYLGVMNGRGVTCRAPDTGGEPERRLVEQYQGWASAVSASAPRMARVLRQIAESYSSTPAGRTTSGSSTSSGTEPPLVRCVCVSHQFRVVLVGREWGSRARRRQGGGYNRAMPIHAQLSAALNEIRTSDAIVVVGAGASFLAGMPLAGQLAPLVWQTLDAHPQVRRATCEQIGVREGPAKDVIGHARWNLIATAFSQIARDADARCQFQQSFAQLDRERADTPSPAHAALARLVHARRALHVVSLNWDTLLEAAFHTLYGIDINAQGPKLWKPHGDCRRPDDAWVLPHEPGSVPDELVERMTALARERPRTLLIVGYSERDEVVVERLIRPLAGGWRVFRISPSANGEGAIPLPAQEALEFLTRELCQALTIPVGSTFPSPTSVVSKPPSAGSGWARGMLMRAPACPISNPPPGHWISSTRWRSPEAQAAGSPSRPGNLPGCTTARAGRCCVRLSTPLVRPPTRPPWPAQRPGGRSLSSTTCRLTRRIS